MADDVSTDELRQMVREALRDLLPAVKVQTPAADASPFASRLRAAVAGGRKVDVAVASDADLTAFARDVVKVAELPDLRAALDAGKLSFAIRRSEAASLPAQRGTHRLDKGVLTEALVVEIGKTNGRVVLGKSVAVTPLARDRARETKLEIVRDKP